MTFEKQLHERATSKCELCASNLDLSVYDVQPNSGESIDSSVLVCGTCSAALSKPETADTKHWYCLRDSMWSEHAAVKVVVYRILKGLGDHALAHELLEQIYMDDETRKWAENAPKSERESSVTILDSNGTRLEEGDTVTLIKDLEVKGANFTAKRGTTVKNINLTDDARYVEGRVNGMRIVLVAAYLKKA